MEILTEIGEFCPNESQLQEHIIRTNIRWLLQEVLAKTYFIHIELEDKWICDPCDKIIKGNHGYWMIDRSE